MSKKKAQHVHKYERGLLGNDHEIYKCMLPGCRHYMPNVFLVIGQLSMCWGNCGNAVMMTKQMVNHDKVKFPMCDSCRQERKQKLQAMKEIPQELEN